MTIDRPSHLMCSEVQRVGRASGKPCGLRASRLINGIPLCGNHARLVTDVRRKEPAKGIAVGNKMQISVRFDKATFSIMQDMAADRGSSFAAMNRALVDYSIDELALLGGQNSLAVDDESKDDE